MDFEKTTEREWINRRISAVSARYTAFDALVNHGIELIDPDTSLQIFCPFHDNKNTPAARYYSSSGHNESHFYCFKCKSRLNGVALFAKFNNIKFLEALSRLERKFGISVPKIDLSIPIEPSNRDHTYKSVARFDIPRMIDIAEAKLVRCRDKCAFNEYISFCKRIDEVIIRFDTVKQSDEEMVIDLQKIIDALNEILTRPEDPIAF